MKSGTIGWSAIVLLLLVFLLGPIVLVVFFSFGSNPLIGFPMGQPTFAWYRKLVADTGFHSAFRISAIVAVATALFATAAGTAAALALDRMAPRLARSITAMVSLPVMLPPLVIAIGIVVLFVRGFSLDLGVPVVVLGHVLVTQPFVILIVLSRLKSFDWSSVDAARDLGASPWQSFRLVILPQISAAIVGSALIAASISLDDFIIASFTLGGGNTISTFVWGKLRTTLDPSINAIATVLLILTVVCAGLALRLTRYRG
ncbi:MAG TPA: ABC transporter permease [Aestuariivirgaceae bacterium]|jgi:spermidine/putrescine transport system permease protein